MNYSAVVHLTCDPIFLSLAILENLASFPEMIGPMLYVMAAFLKLPIEADP